MLGNQSLSFKLFEENYRRSGGAFVLSKTFANSYDYGQVSNLTGELIALSLIKEAVTLAN